MKPRPYIGITGFKTAEEVREVAASFLEHLPKDYLGMLGFLCSKKRLRLPSEPAKQGPAFNDLAGLIEKVPRMSFLPAIHYYTTELDLADQMKQVFGDTGIYESGNCRAVQLNMPWPDLEEIRKARETFPQLILILQLPKQVLGDVQKVAARAKEYSTCASYVLIDPSGGYGKEMDIPYTSELASALQEALPMTRVGVAGGLGPDNVLETLQQLNMRDICIDAQGNLRGESKGEMSITKAHIYINRASYFFRSAERL